MIRTELLEVRGMRCGGCERSVRKALESLPGVQSASADHLAEEVSVTYDAGAVDEAALRSALAEAGFPASGPAITSR